MNSKQEISISDKIIGFIFLFIILWVLSLVFNINDRHDYNELGQTREQYNERF